MFKIPIITSCPVTRVTQAIIHLHPNVVRQINGLLQSEKGLEWAAIGRGWTSPSGRSIYVTSLWIPPQMRSSASVNIDEIDLTPADICVFHSHHGMGAFFSNTDHTQLNPRFPASVVVAELGANPPSELETAYGFAYQGTAVVTLPCKSLGRVSADLVNPMAVVDWKFEEGHGSDEVEWTEGGTDVSNFENRTVATHGLTQTKTGDCPHVKTTTLTMSDGVVDKVYGRKSVACRDYITPSIDEIVMLPNVFGDPLPDLVDQLPAPRAYTVGTLVTDVVGNKPALEGWSTVGSQKKSKRQWPEYSWYDEQFDDFVQDHPQEDELEHLIKTINQLRLEYNWEEFSLALSDPALHHKLFLSNQELALLKDLYV